MSLRIAPQSVDQVLKYFELVGAELNRSRLGFDFAIVVIDEDNIRRGAIAMIADGEKCELGHLYTDGTEQAGSLLYGAAWRAAKALGYKQITI